MSAPCVCGHAEFLHAGGPCMRFFLGCCCDIYEADDGKDVHPSSVLAKAKSDPYEGIYSGRNWS